MENKQSQNPSKAAPVAARDSSIDKNPHSRPTRVNSILKQSIRLHAMAK